METKKNMKEAPDATNGIVLAERRCWRVWRWSIEKPMAFREVAVSVL